MTASSALCLLLLFGAEPTTARCDLLVVVGASGTEQYGEEFARWATDWARAAARGGAALHRLGPGSAGKTASVAASSENDGLADRDALAAAIDQQLLETSRPLWLVLIGHGTFDGREGRFNLRGPDITDQWLQKRLAKCRRPLAVALCFSSSAPFLDRLSQRGRVVISATKSGFEQNYSRFGGYLAAATADLGADLDKDGQTSLLEAYLLAATQTRQFYDAENRLATEHALLDDNGDKKGTPADWFHGIRPVKSPREGALDGLLANQSHLVPSALEKDASPEFLAQRDALERQIEALRSRRGKLSDDDYFAQLEPLMIKLANLYAALD